VFATLEQFLLAAWCAGRAGCSRGVSFNIQVISFMKTYGLMSCNEEKGRK